MMPTLEVGDVWKVSSDEWRRVDSIDADGLVQCYERKPNEPEFPYGRVSLSLKKLQAWVVERGAKKLSPEAVAAADLAWKGGTGMPTLKPAKPLSADELAEWKADHDREKPTMNGPVADYLDRLFATVDAKRCLVDRAAEIIRKVSAHAETFDAYPAPPADETAILITAGVDQDTCTVLRARDARQARDLMAELEGK